MNRLQSSAREHLGDVADRDLARQQLRCEPDLPTGVTGSQSGYRSGTAPISPHAATSRSTSRASPVASASSSAMAEVRAWAQAHAVWTAIDCAMAIRVVANPPSNSAFVTPTTSLPRSRSMRSIMHTMRNPFRRFHHIASSGRQSTTSTAATRAGRPGAGRRRRHLLASPRSRGGTRPPRRSRSTRPRCRRRGSLRRPRCDRRR